MTARRPGDNDLLGHELGRPRPTSAVDCCCHGHNAVMELRNLRYFLAVAETLNFSRAAERLTMAASPLSRSIQQLEAELGGQLFARGTRKVELTRLGEALVPLARKTLADVDALKREMHRRVQGHPEFHVGMRSVPAEFVAEVTGDVILQVAPDARVRVEPLGSYAQTERILNGSLDLGLINRLTEDGRLEYLPVLVESVAMALPDRPRYARLDVVRPEDIADLRLLVQPGVELVGPVLAAYRDAAVDVVHIGSDVIGGLPTVIALGDSCCVAIANPGAPWHRYLSVDGVIIRPLPASVPQATTYLAWRGDRDTDNDLGPILSRARSRFASPRLL